MDNLIKDFINQNEQQIMYITGQAGTGKTTLLNQILNYLASYLHKDNNPKIIVSSYTHKALNITKKIINKSDSVVFATLHSVLKLRPFINESALDFNEVDLNFSRNESSLKTIEYLIVDEFSMINEYEKFL